MSRPRLAIASQPLVADRHRHDVPAVLLELALGEPLLQPRGVRGLARGALGRAVGVEQEHAGVEHPGQPLDHRRARLRLSQRVDQVALDRGQALVGVQVAGEQRAVDEADDVPERRPERDGEDGERSLARLLEQRRRDALEHEVDADPERAIPPSSSSSISAFWAAMLPLRRIPAVSITQRRSRKRVGLLDVDAVRAGDLAVERTRAPAQQREPEVLLGDEVTEDQRRRGGLHAPGV